MAVPVPDQAGGRAIDYVPVATLWVSAEPGTAAETQRAGRLCRVRSWTLWARYRADLVAGSRLILTNHMIQVQAVLDPDGRRFWLRVTGEEECA